MFISKYIRRISQGMIFLFIFLALQAVFMQPTSYAVTNAIYEETVVTESVYTDDTTDYTLSFRISNTLSIGDTITIEVPKGYSIGPVGVKGVFHDAAVLPVQINNPTVDNNGKTIVELVLDSGVCSCELVEINIELVNPSSFGVHVFHIYTSKDTTPVALQVPIIETSIPELKVTPYGSRLINDIPSSYIFEFIAMAPIVADTDMILYFPLDAGVLDEASKPEYGNGLKVQNDYTINYEIDYQSDTITIKAPYDIPSLTPVKITLEENMGVKNPSTPGYHSFSIKTFGYDEPTTNGDVYFHESGGDMLEDVDVQEVYDGDVNYLKIDFTNHIDLGLDQYPYVQIDFPFYIEPNTFDMNAVISINETTTVPTVATLTESSLKISIPDRIKASTRSTIMIPINENISLQTGSHSVDVFSSTELSSFTFPLEIEGKQVQNLWGLPTSMKLGENTALNIQFISNRQLFANQSSIIVEFPTYVTLPSEINPEWITLDGEALESVDKYDEHTLILRVPHEVNKSTSVSIVFSQNFGLINPFEQGEYAFNVKVDDGNFNRYQTFTVVYTHVSSGGNGGSPTSSPTNVTFFDQDGLAGSIAGFMQWFGPQIQTGIESYSIFFINSSGDIVSEIKKVPVDLENNNYTLDLENTAIPAGATRIGVRSNFVDSYGEMVTIALWDGPFHYPLEIRYDDTDLTVGNINGILTWNKPPTETGIHNYRISYHSTEYEDIQIGLVPADGSAVYTYAIPEEIANNQAVLYLNLVNEHNEMGGRQFVVTMMDYTSASTIPTSMEKAELPLPASVFYYDYNTEIGNQVGYVYWENLNEAPDITGYQLSYVMSNETTQPFADVKMKSHGQYRIYLSSISNGPSGVATGVRAISIRSMDSAGNVSPPVVVDIEDQASVSHHVNYPEFYDFDMTSGELAGTITWEHPQVVSLLNGYEIYFVDDHYRRISKIGAVTTGVNQFIIPPNTVIPPGAIGIAIFSKIHVLMSNPAIIYMIDTEMNANYSPLYRSKMTSMMDVNKDGLEIDDVVKYLATQYDMNGDNTFDENDVYWMLGLLIPMIYIG
jgi:hypothetical protein